MALVRDLAIDAFVHRVRIGVRIRGMILESDWFDVPQNCPCSRG